MSPERPPSPAATPPPSGRGWPLLVLCVTIIAAIVIIMLVKTCPPVPVPGGKPAPVEATTPTIAVPVPEASKPVASAPVLAPIAAPVIVVDVPAAKGSK